MSARNRAARSKRAGVVGPMSVTRPVRSSTASVTVLPGATFRSTKAARPRAISMRETSSAAAAVCEAGALSRFPADRKSSMFIAPSGVRSTVTVTPSRTIARTSTRRESSGQKATLTDTRSAESRAGDSKPALLWTTIFSTRAPGPERIWIRMDPISTLRWRLCSAAAITRARSASSETKKGSARTSRTRKPTMAAAMIDRRRTVGDMRGGGSKFPANGRMSRTRPVMLEGQEALWASSRSRNRRSASFVTSDRARR